MRKGDGLEIISHIINFAIVIYFISFLLSNNMLTTFDAIISFFGLFISLIANIYSAIEKYKGE